MHNVHVHLESGTCGVCGRPFTHPAGTSGSICPRCEGTAFMYTAMLGMVIGATGGLGLAGIFAAGVIGGAIDKILLDRLFRAIRTEKLFPGQPKKIKHDELELDINSEAVTAKSELTIISTKRQHAIEKKSPMIGLPPLETRMVNVTKGPRRAYSIFLSGDKKFNKKVNLKIPYNKDVLPADKTEQDIRTYYYDTETEHWKDLELITLDIQDKNVISATDHTDMVIINAVISGVAK